ncbi:MAG: hypothetical protein PHV59_04265 [Victivallales bacterium]|nr:hypothetical protein [Victivallales bacterium]
MLKKILLLTVMSGMLFFTGCELLEQSMKEVPETRYVLSLHKVVRYPRAKDLERKIASFDGREFWINTNPFFHSKNVEKVELIPSKEKKGFYDLQLQLDYNGVMKWLQMSNEFKNEELALLIDGHFAKLYKPDQLSDEEDNLVLLNGPFDKVTANGVKKYARKNYYYFNPNKKNIMQMFEEL